MVRPIYYVRKGGTDYTLLSFDFEREGSESIDQTPFRVSKANAANLDIGDDVSIGYYVGAVFTEDFNGDIVSKSVNETSEYILESYGGRLNRAEHFSKIYDNQAPEAIVEDIIDTYVTTLTYASTATSGVTIERFRVKDETPAEAIQRLVTLLNWQIRTDNSKNFYFEPQGTTTNPNVITIGTNGFIEGTWNYTPNSIINALTFKGGNAVFNTSESFTATASQTEFTVTRKIAGNVRITDNGTEVVGGVEGSSTPYDYTIDSDNNTITFEVGRTNGHTIVINYSYEVPIKITAKDTPSITANTIFSRKITEKNIVTMADARKRVKQIFKTYSTLTKQAVIIVKYDSNYLPGETVQVIDSFNSIDQSLVISKVSLSYPNGVKKIVIGTPPLDNYSWQKGIDDRLRALEQAQDNTDKQQEYRGFVEYVNVLNRVGRIRVRSNTLGHAWIVGSATNGIVGANTGTEDGSQQVVGGAGRVETIVSVVNYQDLFKERFNFTTFIDTGNTTCTIDTTDEQAEFTTGEILQSLSCFKGDGTITSATLTSDSTTNLTFQMSANGGSNWENVTSGTAHTFTNTGTNLLYKATASDTATIGLITIQKN